MKYSTIRAVVVYGMIAGILTPQPAAAVDVVHADDVIIEGSLCVSDDNACADGEAFPGNADIKIKDALPYILFEDTSASSSPDRDYRIAIGGAGTTASEYFAIEDAGASGTGTTQVFRIDGGAPANTLRLDSLGNVGLGTATPTEELHIRRASGAGSVRILTDSTDNGAVQWVMRTNSTNRRFLAQDSAGNNQSQILFENAGTVKFLGPTAAVPLMTVSPSGLSLPASAYCGSNGAAPSPGGCDAVFTPNHPIESIEEHAAAMWQNSHLPAIGPTPDGKTIEFNVHQRYFTMLNELEKAHIYIERLNEQVKQQKADFTAALAEKDQRLEELEQRMARMEALLRSKWEADD